jgi:hypothetical protein
MNQNPAAAQMRIVLDTHILARGPALEKRGAGSFCSRFWNRQRARVGLVAVFVARNGASVELSPLASPVAADIIGHRAIDTGSSGFHGVG